MTGGHRVRSTPGGAAGESASGMEFVGRVQQFFREVTAEFRRVNWPSRAEVMRSTTVVLAVVVVLAMYLGAVDVVLARIVGVILR
jgi:preprotein translocase subunit SecE